MKSTLILLSFVITALTANSQYEMEPMWGDKKTEFRHSIFRVNYHTQIILTRFLEQSTAAISFDLDSVKIVGKDLFYNSPEYRYEKKVEGFAKGEHLTTTAQKIKLLDGALSLNESWRTAIIENEPLLTEIILRITHGFDLTIEGNTIYAEGPPPVEGHGNAVYKFEFDKKNQLISKGLGRRSDANERLYWMSWSYTYKKGHMVEEVLKKCNDITCKVGYELKTIKYTKNGISESVTQTYSRQNNDFIFEERTNYFYSKKVLDSSVTNNFYMGGETPTLSRTRVNTFESGRSQTVSDEWLSVERHKDQKSFLKHNYDSQNRLASTDYKGWDNNGEVRTVYVEEYEYLTNAYVYRYIESFKKERGKEKLPLQYEMTYSFY